MNLGGIGNNILVSAPVIGKRLKIEPNTYVKLLNYPRIERLVANQKKY